MTYLQYDRIEKELLAAIPELAEYENDLRKWNREPGQYIVLWFVLKPFLQKLLDAGENEEGLSRAFAFLEDMARSKDLDVVNLLYVGLLESLVGDRMRLRQSWQYMGKETRALARRAAHALLCEGNLPEA